MKIFRYLLILPKSWLMGQYKGISIPDKLVDLIASMEDLDQSREELSVLGQQWDLLTILGQMSGSGTNMSETREQFKTLTSELLGTLGIETLKKSVQSLSSKSQVAVDIVIRNLFERTADIGFLATDEDIRTFLKNPPSNDNRFEVETLRNRFAEYVSKYSVYSDIILMNTEGEVLCQFQYEKNIQKSKDPILQEALTTNKEFVERFAYSDLNPSESSSLIYGFRVRESGDINSKVLGVLCLVFKFQDELEMVFKNLIDNEDWTVLTLLDAQGKVIASSDATQVALGSLIPIDPTSEFHITKFGGRKYLAKTCPTKGYQGFKGLGWFGHAMIPLDYAFTKTSGTNQPIAPDVISAVTENNSLFSDDLRQIPKHAEAIQSELDRTVWNGNVRQEISSNKDSSARKVLLWEISSTGNKTRNVFEKSIGGLHETVVSSIFSESEFISSLAIDIMDRNLYERANVAGGGP